MKKIDVYNLYLGIVAVTAFSGALFTTMSSVYRVNAGLNAMQLVLVGTMLELSVFIFEIPTGVVADTYSRRLSIIIGYGLTGIAFIVEGSFPVVGAIWLAQWIWGFGYTFTSGAQSAWLADEIGPEKLTGAFLRAAQVGAIFSLIGIGVSTLLGLIAPKWAMIAGGCGFLMTTLLLVLFMPETGFKPQPAAERDTWNDMRRIFREGVSLVRKSNMLILIFIISFVIGLASEGLDRFWVAHFIRNITLPPIGSLDTVAWFGLMNIVTSLLTIGATELIRRRIEHGNEETGIRMLVLLKIVMIAGIFTFSLAGNFALALAAYWTTFVFRNMTNPIFDGWINRRIPADSTARATVLSMHGQMDAIGQILSGPLMGIIATASSIAIALTAVGGLWLVTIPLLLWGIVTIRQQKKTAV